MSASENIANALSRARAKADLHHAHIIQTKDLTRTDREILLATGWLQEIIRGWYMLVRPDVATGDTAAWYANYWDFLRIYLSERFGEEYCLSAESSLDLHVEKPTVPKQVIVIAKQGAGLRGMMHGTSLMIYADYKNFPDDIMQKQGLNIMRLGSALVKVAPSYFQHQARDAEIALRSIKTPDEITKVVARHDLKKGAARMVGAYQFLGNQQFADTIFNDLKRVGVLFSPENPFQQTQPLLQNLRVTSPYAARIQAMWAQARDSLLANFPKASGLPKDKKTYLQHIDEIYQFDAYNSLSIEGYQVTHALIECVKSQDWNPSENEDDKNMRNAMAAKGYYDAFLQVKKSVERILQGENAAAVIKEDLQTWYKNLFGPSVQAGIIKAEDLFGYRNDRVFIRNSLHSPPPKEAVLDAMESLFDCLAHEPDPGVAAVLGHYFFVFIHPYMDGNGRIGRFLMNVLLASGGYPWTVVRVDNRMEYISTLEKTHTEFDMTHFARFIAAEMQGSEALFKK